MGILFRKGNVSFNEHFSNDKPLSDANPEFSRWIRVADGDVPVRKGEILSGESVLRDGDVISFMPEEEAKKSLRR